MVGAASTPKAVRIAPSAASNPAIDRNNRDSMSDPLAWVAPELAARSASTSRASASAVSAWSTAARCV